MKPRWFIEPVADLEKRMGMTDGTFRYVAAVRWWQFWRWAFLFNSSEDYLKSRLKEIEMVKTMAEDIKNEFETGEKP